MEWQDKHIHSSFAEGRGEKHARPQTPGQESVLQLPWLLLFLNLGVFYAHNRGPAQDGKVINSRRGGRREPAAALLMPRHEHGISTSGPVSTTVDGGFPVQGFLGAPFLWNKSRPL